MGTHKYTYLFLLPSRAEGILRKGQDHRRTGNFWFRQPHGVPMFPLAYFHACMHFNRFFGAFA